MKQQSGVGCGVGGIAAFELCSLDNVSVKSCELFVVSV